MGPPSSEGEYTSTHIENSFTRRGGNWLRIVHIIRHSYSGNLNMVVVISVSGRNKSGYGKHPDPFLQIQIQMWY